MVVQCSFTTGCIVVFGVKMRFICLVICIKENVIDITGSFRRLQFVSHARVPILKLESKFDNIPCDISINNLSGYVKSNFLLWISIIDRRFRDMVLLVWFSNNYSILLNFLSLYRGSG